MSRKPILLAIDASDKTCSLALQTYDNNKKSVNIASKTIDNTQLQAALLLLTIDELLEVNNTKLDEVDALVLSHGPGRFTGLRISTSCIHGLAYSLDKSIITINSLQLRAQQYVDTAKRKCINTIWVCLKANNNFFYQEKYIVDNGLVYPEEPTKKTSYVKTKTDIIDELNDAEPNSYNFVGSGWLDIFDLDNTEDTHDISHIYLEPVNVKHSFKFANLDYDAGIFYSPYDVLPVYGVNPYKVK